MVGRASIAADRSLSAVHHPRVRARLLSTALYGVAAFVSALPASLNLRSAFISTGLPGYGEAATGDHLQTSYRFWLGCPPERSAVGQRSGPLRGVENQLNPAVFDGIDDIGAAFRNLVDLDGVHPVFRQKTLGT